MLDGPGCVRLRLSSGCRLHRQRRQLHLDGDVEVELLAAGLGAEVQQAEGGANVNANACQRTACLPSSIVRLCTMTRPICWTSAKYSVLLVRCLGCVVWCAHCHDIVVCRAFVHYMYTHPAPIYAAVNMHQCMTLAYFLI